jgi:hypothetical protein
MTFPPIPREGSERSETTPFLGSLCSSHSLPGKGIGLISLSASLILSQSYSFYISLIAHHPSL